QHFAVNEKIVVQDAGRQGQQVGLFLFFCLRSSAPLLSQKIVIRHHHRFRLLRSQLLPLVTPDIPAHRKLHHRSLHGCSGSIVRLELGIDDAAAARLIDRERLGSYTMAVLEHAEGPGVDVLPLMFLLLLLWHGSGACQGARRRHAPDQCHHESQPPPIRPLQCDSPLPKLVRSIRVKPGPASSGVPLSCNAPSISAQMEANCLPVVATTTLAWRYEGRRSAYRRANCSGSPRSGRSTPSVRLRCQSSDAGASKKTDGHCRSNSRFLS